MTCAGKSSFRPFQNTWPHSSRPFLHKVIRVQSWPIGGGVRVRVGDPEVAEGWDSEWRSQSDPVTSLSSLGALTPSCLLIGLLTKCWARSTWGLHFWVVLDGKSDLNREFFFCWVEKADCLICRSWEQDGHVNAFWNLSLSRKVTQWAG